MEKLKGAFHDAVTGETIVRDLTDEEIEQLPEQITPVDVPNHEK